MNNTSNVQLPKKFRYKSPPPKKRTWLPGKPPIKGALPIVLPAPKPKETKTDWRKTAERIAIHIEDDHTTNSGIKAIKKSLQASGMMVVNVLSSFGIITGWVQKNRIKELVVLPGIKSVETSPKY